MDKKSMTLGWLVGRQIAGMRRAKPPTTEPLQPPMGSGEFLFNDKRFYAFPEYDQKLYKYAVILDNGYGGLESMARVFSSYEDNGDVLTYHDAMWCKSWNGAEWGEWTANSSATITKSKILWANFDVLNSNGSVYLPASDPVPVYA